MNENNVLLLLGGTLAWHQFGAPCVKQAKKRGLSVWLIDTEENLSRMPELISAVDRIIAFPYLHPETCAKWAQEQNETTSIIGVFSYLEYAMESTTTIANILGLKGNALESVQNIRNKFTCRQLLRQHGFRQPQGALCSSIEDAKAFAAANLPGPWIVKPQATWGSVGVSLVSGPQDWEQAIDHLRKSLDKLQFLFKQEIPSIIANNPLFLVECFQQGDEFSAEGVFISDQPYVLALTTKMTTCAPYFVEIGHTMPAELEETVEKKAITTIKAALKTLGLTWGNFHVEFWLDDGEPVIGEVHIRPGGDYISHMTEIVTGLEIYGVIFDQMLGHVPDITKVQPAQAAAMRYLTPGPGRITAIHGWERVIADADCVASALTLAVGDLVTPLQSYTDRYSFVLTRGKTAQDAAAKAEQLCSATHIEVAEYASGEQ